MSKNPNPQGKGQVPVLAALAEGRTAALHVPAKRIEQVSTELFTSLFILESEFRFKPVPGRPYWLYRKDGAFRLSIIPPHGWYEQVSGRYIGECQLQDDMTWTLELAEDVAEDAEFLNFLEEKRKAFERDLSEAESVEDALPRFKANFPFYQRVFAFALSSSLDASMDKSGIKGLSYEEALGQITDQSDED